ncbi:hypothetical protein [Kribbella sp. NPDC055071]
MSVMEFVAALVQAMAWPVVVLVVALLFRSKIIELLTPAIRKLKAGPFEVEWDRTISKAEVELEQPGLPPIAARVLPRDSLVDELGELARAMPTAAVMEAAARVEAELRNTVSGELAARGIPMPSPTSLASLARLGRQHDVVTEETLRAIEGLAVLRNMASHGLAADTTAERAIEFLTLADAVMYTVRAQGGGRGGRGGAASVGRNGVAIGGPGGGAGPGGTGGDGGGGQVEGDGLAVGGEGGEAGQLDRGGRGGRSGMEIAAAAGIIPPPPDWMLQYGRGGAGAGERPASSPDDPDANPPNTPTSAP